MRSTLLQRFFAYFYAYTVPAWIGLALGAAVVAGVVWPSMQVSAADFFGGIVLIVMGAALGILLCIFPGCFVFGPLMRSAAERNGAPFSVGDRVLVLRGRHRGRVLRIYEVWRECGQVRIELGEREHAAVTDVFSDVEVCRVEGE
jgi:hypothetical protein